MRKKAQPSEPPLKGGGGKSLGPRKREAPPKTWHGIKCRNTQINSSPTKILPFQNFQSRDADFLRFVGQTPTRGFYMVPPHLSQQQTVLYKQQQYTDRSIQREPDDEKLLDPASRRRRCCCPVCVNNNAITKKSPLSTSQLNSEAEFPSAGPGGGGGGVWS